MAATMVATATTPQASQMSKPAYFILHRYAAREALDKKDEVFSERNVLLKELKTLYDWMALEPNDDVRKDGIVRTSEDGDGHKRIPLRHFKRRLPEIHRKFPLLASSFARMDTDNNCWLDYDEFVEFCLKDQRLQERMRRSTIVQVYGLDSNGNRVYKDDLSHMCEMGTPMPLLPWETAQVVEWRIEGLRLSHKGSPTFYAGMEVRAGSSIASPPFRAAGVCGFLRFWPRGYWTESMRRRKASAPPGMEDLAAGGPCHLPGPDAWCCLGACMPVGSHLALRFFILDEKSERKECFWCEGTSASQLWAPSAKAPNPKSNETIVVGIEILHNYDSTDCRSSVGSMRATKRMSRRPALQKDPLESGDVQGSIFLGRARSLPTLTKLPKKLPRQADPPAPHLSVPPSPTAGSGASTPQARMPRGSPPARSATSLRDVFAGAAPRPLHAF